MHTGFGLEAKNVDLVIRDESQIKFGVLESTVQSSAVKVERIWCKRTGGKRKKKHFRTDCNKVRGYREELKES